MYEKGACNTRIAAAVLNLICEYQKGENPWHDIILCLLKTLNFKFLEDINWRKNKYTAEDLGTIPYPLKSFAVLNK